MCETDIIVSYDINLCSDDQVYRMMGLDFKS